MSAIKQGGGSEILAARHETTVGKHALPQIKNVLIVEDSSIDSERLRATLHIILGRDLNVRVAETLGSALDSVLADMPDIVFLDDYLKPNDSAIETIPFLRRAGYEGHIIVISSELDRQRKLRLMSLGAAQALHKDDVDSSQIADALVQAHAKDN